MPPRHRTAAVLTPPFLAAGLLCAVLSGAACAQSREAAGAEPPLLRVARPEPAPATTELELPARTAPAEQALIYSRATGVVSERRVDLGDRVKAGQVLAVISAPDVDRSVERARATVSQARARLELAEKNFERGQSLVRRKFLSEEELDERRSSVKVARADLEVAEAESNRLAAIQGFQTLRAPFAGVIAERRVDRGDRVTGDQSPAGGHLFRLMRVDELRVEVDVPPAAALTLQPGTETEVRFAELPGERFPARVEHRSGLIDARAGTMRVELRMLNPGERIPAGMVGQAVLRLPRRGEPLLVPDNAVVVRNGVPHVATVEPGSTIRFLPVKLGQARGDRIEVTQGLAPGTSVVVAPNALLRDGDPVRVAPPPERPGGGTP
jgi:RND family efflux transporter MFP subunit